MFKNVGNKIKTVSVLLLIAGILLSAYIGIFGHMISGGEASSNADELILGVVIIVFGVIASVVLSLIVNGFGVIVENAEMLDEIRTLVLEIDNKQSSHRSDNKKSASILNSSFNSEVFDDRDFSAEEPANPDYVKPVPGHEVAASRYVPPTYSGHGKETRAPKTGFGTQNMGDDYLPAQETPITGAFDEPDFEEFSEPAPQAMQQRVPQPAAQPAPQAMQQRAPQSAAQPIPQAMQQRAPQSAAQPIPQAMQQRAPQPAAQPTPQAMQQRVPQPAAQPAPQAMQQRVPQPAAQPAQQRAPQPAAQPAPQPAQQRAPQPAAQPAQQSAFRPMQQPAMPRMPQYEAPVTSAFDEPDFDEFDEPGVYESHEKPKKVLTPEEAERAGQIQELIFKFVARRNGKVDVNDILRTVPRNVEPSEFHDAIHVLEEEGKLVKDAEGNFTAIK